MKLATTAKALTIITFMASSAAHAGLLGDEVQARWVNAPFFDQTSVFVVNQGIELNGTWGVDSNLDVGDNYIEATIPNGVGIVSGPNWHFSSLDYGGITGVAISTNFDGWNDSWLSFTADSIDVTFFGEVRFPRGEGRIRFSLLPSVTSVPEPASGISLACGLAALFVVIRRRLRPSMQSSDRNTPTSWTTTQREAMAI